MPITIIRIKYCFENCMASHYMILVKSKSIVVAYWKFRVLSRINSKNYKDFAMNKSQQALLKRAKTLMWKDEYLKAEKILLPLYQSFPDSVHILEELWYVLSNECKWNDDYRVIYRKLIRLVLQSVGDESKSVDLLIGHIIWLPFTANQMKLIVMKYTQQYVSFS